MVTLVVSVKPELCSDYGAADSSYSTGVKPCDIVSD